MENKKVTEQKEYEQKDGLVSIILGKINTIPWKTVFKKSKGKTSSSTGTWKDAGALNYLTVVNSVGGKKAVKNSKTL